MTVGIAVLTTVASSAPRLIPSRRPAVIHRLRLRLTGRGPDVSGIRSGYHAHHGLPFLAQERPYETCRHDSGADRSADGSCDGRLVGTARYRRGRDVREPGL